MYYFYGMRLRGYSIGCQPGRPVQRIDDNTGKYHDIIVYDHKLSAEDAWNYDLDLIRESEDL